MNCAKCETANSVDNVLCVYCGEPLQAPTGEKTEKFSNISLPSTPTISNYTTDNLSGNTFEGKYQLEAKIGEGGMGAVYVAQRLHIGDKAAVKVLHSHKMNDPTAGERFRREVQMAAQLKHPNVVSIYDYGITRDGLHYIVMELVEGRTLRQLISKQGVLPLPLVANITSQVCAALEEAHRQGLIHRDIKPDNINVQETPDGLRVTVLDFGIAKLQESSSNLTQTDAILGTPRYMSPEQCSGEKLSGSSDIYSFGIVLYEMLCGVVPFNAPSSTAVAIQQVTQPPPPLRQTNNTLSPLVEQVVLHALEKKVEDRPVSAMALASGLNEAIQGVRLTQPKFTVPSEQSPSSPAVYSNPTSANHPQTVSSPSLTDESEISPGFPVGQPDQPSNQTRKSNTPFLLLLLAFGFVLFLGAGGFALWLFMPSADEKAEIELPNAINDQPNSQPDLTRDDNFEDTDPLNGQITVSADDELKTLSEELLHSSPNDLKKVEEKLKKAEEKYPNDYRFTYELAKLYTPLPNHHEPFNALFEAARKAIKNNQAPKMLDEIKRDGGGVFKRLVSGHREWTTIENALQKKDVSILPEEEHH